MDSIPKLIDQQANFISRHQLPSGAIPWYEDGITDPWDHVECAIAMDLTGRFDVAVRAYHWLRDVQNPDGSWYAGYHNDKPSDLTLDTNFTSYIATGLWYHFLVTGEVGLLREMMSAVEKAIDFVLNLQQPTGEIHWACTPEGKVWPGAILGSSCCIWQSLRNAVRTAELLGLDRPAWEEAGRRLRDAIRNRPDIFDKYGENNRCFATNWYYPVLTGVLEGDEAKALIDKHWHDFVVENWGCKCVMGTPWVTVGETTELIMSLYRIRDTARAGAMMNWILRLNDHGGGFQTGIKLPDQMIWPEEQNTWTSAGVIMALSSQAKTNGKRVEGLYVR